MHAVQRIHIIGRCVADVDGCRQVRLQIIPQAGYALSPHLLAAGSHYNQVTVRRFSLPFQQFQSIQNAGKAGPVIQCRSGQAVFRKHPRRHVEIDRGSGSDAGSCLFLCHARIKEQIFHCGCILFFIPGIRQAANDTSIQFAVGSCDGHPAAGQHPGIHSAALFHQKKSFFCYFTDHQSHLVEMGIQQQDRRVFPATGPSADEVSEPVHLHRVHIWLQQLCCRTGRTDLPAGNPAEA